MENLLIEWGGKSASLFGPTHLWNLLKITTVLVYLALFFYLAPESNVWKRSSLKSWVRKPKLNNSKPNAEYTNKVLLIPLMAKPINHFLFCFHCCFFWLIFFCCFFLSSSSAHQMRSRDLYRGDSWIDVVEQFWFFKLRQFDKFFIISGFFLQSTTLINCSATLV